MWLIPVLDQRGGNVEQAEAEAGIVEVDYADIGSRSQDIFPDKIGMDQAVVGAACISLRSRIPKRVISYPRIRLPATVR